MTIRLRDLALFTAASVAYLSLAFGEGPVFRHKDAIAQQEFENVYQDIRSLDTSVTISSATLPGGATSYIQNTNTLQSGASFFVLNGTVSGSLAVSTITLNGNSIQATGGTRVYTVPNAGANASFVMTESAQTINGIKSFGNSVLGPTGSGSTMTFGHVTDTDSGLRLDGSGGTTLVNNGTAGLIVVPSIIELQRNTNPATAGTLNFGDAAQYWADISYKTLTDRGCLGWFDEGVEAFDGTFTTDLASFAKIAMHPTKETVYGKPMLDYRTFPKIAYKIAEVNGRVLPRDKDNEPIGGQDGVEMTAMFSIMIGALKEANARIEALEQELAALK